MKGGYAIYLDWKIISLVYDKKMKLAARFLLFVSWFWWCQGGSFDTLLTPSVQSVLSGTVEPTGSLSDTSGSFWMRFWVFADTRIWFLTPQYLYVILLQMGVLGSVCPDWIHIVPKGYVNLMAYVRDMKHRHQNTTALLFSIFDVNFHW